MFLRRRSLVWITTLLLHSAVASAQDDAETTVEQARTKYDEGLQAVTAEDYPLAAQRFAEADDLAPSPQALTAAVRAALLADDGLLAMRLADRGRDRAPDPELNAAIAEVDAAFADRVGHIQLRCASCHAMVRGHRLDPGDRWAVEPGSHDVAVVNASGTTRKTFFVAGGQTVLVTREETPLPPPPAAPLPPPPAPIWAAPPTPDVVEESGLSPAWFGVGLGLSAVLIGGTIASGVDTLARHDDFVANGQGLDDGQDAQLRTNILAFSLAGVAVATGVLAVFTDWGEEEEVQQALRGRWCF